MIAEFTGSLRDSVAIEHWAAAPDDSGGDAGSWTFAGSAWAALVPTDVVATSSIVGERRITRSRYRLTIRAGSGAGLTSRFRWGDRILVVLRVEPDPRTRDRLTLLVEDRT
nr:head-tail adaptor protein [Polymorphobacter sp.]